MIAGNHKHYSQVVEKRKEMEQNFISSLLFGVATGNVKLEDGFDICPPVMLMENTEPRAIAEAMQSLFTERRQINLVSVCDKLTNNGKKKVDLDNIYHNYSFSTYGNESAVKHFAGICLRESLKAKAELLLLEAVGTSQEYGNEVEELQSKVDKVKQSLENGAIEEPNYIGKVFERIMEKAKNNKATKPLSTSFSNLDRVLKGGLAKGELIVLGARPALGKTALAGVIALETARSGKPVLFISREVKDETIVQRMIARTAKIDNRIFRQGADSLKNQLPHIERYADFFSSLPLRIEEKSTVPMSPREVRRMARGMKGVSLVVVDYLQLMNPDEKSNSREREIAEMSRSFKQLALDLDCPVLLLSQLNRKVEEIRRRPQLSDLRESGSLEQDADVVIFLHDPEKTVGVENTYVEVIVAKGRSSGTGMCAMIFEKPTSNFEETEVRHEEKKEKPKENGL